MVFSLTTDLWSSATASAGVLVTSRKKKTLFPRLLFQSYLKVIVATVLLGTFRMSFLRFAPGCNLSLSSGDRSHDLVYSPFCICQTSQTDVCLHVQAIKMTSGGLRRPRVNRKDLEIYVNAKFSFGLSTFAEILFRLWCEVKGSKKLMTDSGCII